MRLIKVAAAVLNQTPLDWDGNLAHIRAAIADARQQGVALLCLPELCLSGYGCEDAFLLPSVAEQSLAVLREVLPDTWGLAVSLGLPVRYHRGLYNAAALCVDGRVRGLVAKRFLAGEGIHYEPRWFKAWPEGVVNELELEGERVPIGDLCFDLEGVKIGFEICEDAWVANRPGGSLADRGIDVILNPSASHFAFGKIEVRQRLVLEGSRAFGVSYVYANLLGNEAGRAIYDGGALIASGGKLVAVGPRFSYQDAQVTAAIIDVDATRAPSVGSAGLPAQPAGGPVGCVDVAWALPESAPEHHRPVRAAWETGPSLKEEEFTRAEALALLDYLRKSRSRGFVVSMSGGADSSAVACLVALMVDLAAAEIGLEALKGRLPPDPRLTAAGTPREVVGALLTGVYQATRNSSEVTRTAAETVCRALGGEFLALDVDGLVTGYVERVEQAIGRPLAWETDDVALQNIQARVRAPGVWLLTNLRGALLLATSNRSEAAVGYATMDGDTCGGLSPIAGIDKAYLRRWLRWLETTGPAGVHPVPSLALVNAQQPTAELRPAAATQTDEADLMPYDLLDAIERAAIRDRRKPVEVFRWMQSEFPAYDAAQLGVWVERFYRLWSRNQWKRERYAPSFHLDDESLDPKTWCRFPILSGGFERELAELRAHVAATPRPGAERRP
jgi:NAD+ synthase (glutamine-hydrolysing)